MSKRDVNAAALLLFAVITALRFVAGTDVTLGITLLYVVPIALLAVTDGLRAGLAAAALATVLFIGWTVIADVDLHLLGYLTRAVAFLVVGGLVGGLAHQRRAVEASAARWFEMSNDMLCEIDFDGCFTRVNGAWLDCLGYPPAELQHRRFAELVHPDDVERSLAAAGSLSAAPGALVDFENRYGAKDGTWHWLLWSARSDGERIYAVAKDITDRKHFEAEREQLLARAEAMARTDALTGLPNRRAWSDELQRELARSTRSRQLLSVAIVDLDNFKRYNDEYGHPAGDELLRTAAAAWQEAIRDSDFIARYGGEEFAVLLPNCPPENGAEVLDRIRRATPFGQTCSAGVAVWDGQESTEDLLARADAALYEAKREGRDRVTLAGA